MTKVNYLVPILNCNYLLQLSIGTGKLYGVSYLAIKDHEAMPATRHEVSNIRQSIASHEDEKIISQFKQYLSNPAIAWKIDLVWPGVSDFQKTVLDYLSTIPLGTTKTYGQVANDLQTSARAVGNACRRNPFPITIPCHRVVAQNGLGGYDGDINEGRLAIKSLLLKHEQAL